MTNASIHRFSRLCLAGRDRRPAVLAILASAAATLFCAGAMAQQQRAQQPMPQRAAPPATAYYGGLSLARAAFDMNSAALRAQPGSESDSDNGVALYGGYRMSQSLSIEGRYSSVGRYKKNDAATPVDAAIGLKVLGIAAVGRHVFNRDWALTGKLGLANVHTDTRILAPGIVRDDSKNGVKPFAGMGVEYRVAPRWTARGEYEYYALREGNRMHVFSLGMGYDF